MITLNTPNIFGILIVIIVGFLKTYKKYWTLMNTQELNGKLAVITGGSSGIGLAIAEALAKKGAQILIVARNKAKLVEAAEKLSSHSALAIETLSADISLLEDVKRISEKVSTLAPCADIIVNNAGIVSAGYLIDTPLEEWERLYNINVRGLVGLLQQLAPAMETQGLQDQQPRHIVNIASAAGILAVPGMSAYSATKAAVISLSDCLRNELAPAKIGVTTVCPTYVRTPIAETVKLFGRMDTPKTHKQVSKGFANAKLTGNDIARETLKAINKNKGLVVLGNDGKLGDIIQRISRNIFSNQMAKMTLKNHHEIPSK
jgi:short-subunit dehydrogenase